MRRAGWLLIAVLGLGGGAAVADWFSEAFGAGAPLRDPVGTGSTHVWFYYDGGHTSAYPKLVQARDSTTPIEVDDDAGVDGGPAIVSQNTTAGVARYATFALRGTAGARTLTPAGPVVLEFDVQFIGANPENMAIDLYSCVSLGYYDLGVRLKPVGGNLVAYVEYTVPNGVNFGVTPTASSDYVIGTSGVWRGDGLWHHVRVVARPGTITTWTPGVFVGDNNYTGGTLEVAADGAITVELDGTEVLAVDNLALILNFDGQSADESAPGDWAPADRGVEANVGGLSLLDLTILSGSAAVDNVTLGPLETWVDVAECVEQEINSAAFPGGLGRVIGYLWSEDLGSPLPTVQARLYNVTDGVSVGESELVTAAVPTAFTIAAQLTPGVKRYRLQVTSSVAETDIFCSSRGLGI